MLFCDKNIVEIIFTELNKSQDALHEGQTTNKPNATYKRKKSLIRIGQ